ncbi:class I SAM-dependent methyltransferase [bacterium]|nr:class I SAM-dependent methyltransferase [bacterium]
MHRNSRLLFETYALSHFKGMGRILEIGPSDFPSPYCKLVSDSAVTWDTLDITEDDRLTYRGVDPYTFPIEDEVYDLVFSAQVFEHVPKVWVWMKELARITRKGGCIITLNPVSWPYHEHPQDCWRAYPDGMRAVSEDAGLEVVLSKCESIESRGLRKVVPGIGMEWQSRKRILISKMLAPLGFPVEAAFDTVTVACKPEA